MQKRTDPRKLLKSILTIKEGEDATYVPVCIIWLDAHTPDKGDEWHKLKPGEYKTDMEGAHVASMGFITGQDDKTLKVTQNIGDKDGFNEVIIIKDNIVSVARWPNFKKIPFRKPDKGGII